MHNTLSIDNITAKTIKQEAESFSGTMEMEVCDNPFCGCGHYAVKYKLESKDDGNAPEEVSIHLDVDEKTVDFINIENYLEGGKLLLDNFESSLTEDDWKLLFNSHRFHKNELIEHFDVDEKMPYEYKFDQEHLDDVGLMINYVEIFPLAEVFRVEKNEVEYELIGAYCKNIKCTCTDIIFTVFKEGEYYTDFRYDYVKNKLDKTNLKWMINQLKIKDSAFVKLIQLRDIQIKNLFTKSLISYLKKENRITRSFLRSLKGEEEEKQKKVGRNEKCPCGSGKKYKKCCMLK